MKLLNNKGHIPPKNILFATDFSRASQEALPHALTIAGQYGSKVYVAHVIGPEFMDLLPPDPTATMLNEARRIAEQKMEPLVSVARQLGVPSQTLIGEGPIWEVLLAMIHQNNIDLVVVGTHGRRGLRKLLLGSVAEEVFRLAPCPVLTVGPRTSAAPEHDARLHHILYPLEFLPDFSDAAIYAVSLAEQHHARLTVMQIREDMAAAPEETVKIEAPIRRWTEDHIAAESDLRGRTTFKLAFGPAGQAILKFATERAVDLIVMGVRRLDPIITAHLPIPDTAYLVVSGAPCPVVTLPDAEIEVPDREIKARAIEVAA